MVLFWGREIATVQLKTSDEFISYYLLEKKNADFPKVMELGCCL